MNLQQAPRLFRQLEELGCLEAGAVRHTADGFWAATRSIAELLSSRGISGLIGSRGTELAGTLFFDDWYVCAVCTGDACTYSLFKMREQEYDAALGLQADGDVPGVTVSFISLREQILLDCLTTATDENKKRLGAEIDRVVADLRQTHSPALKDYFIRTEAQGPYLIARLYTEEIASLSPDGVVAVPERYARDYGTKGLRGRVAQFVEENNRAAGTVICDHRNIYLRDRNNLSMAERLAILATHTGNVSFYSFAAEVQYHAMFLAGWAKVPIPLLGRSAYHSAIRADLSISDGEFTGPTPYYRENSRLVQRQYRCHHEEESNRP